VISQFVASGNGNANGAHDFQTVSGSAEVVEEVAEAETDEIESAKSSSSR